jgi:hypothetical protein
VQSVFISASVSNGGKLSHIGNGTASADSGAALCSAVKPIDTAWTGSLAFNPDGPGVVKVLLTLSLNALFQVSSFIFQIQWDNLFFFEFKFDLPNDVCNATFSSPSNRAAGGCYPCKPEVAERFSCWFYWL